MKMHTLLLFLTLSWYYPQPSLSCTNLLITNKASADGSTLIAYNADSDSLYGTLGHYPAGTHAPGEVIPIYDWDSGVYLGTVDQVNYTYNVIGNMNEFQVTIGESTFGGLEQLAGQDAVLDYGNLIWITLQRSKTAREAIHIMGQLVDEYGYASEGESFSIGDPHEVWILEMIGKGPGQKGAVWVAMRIPDGHVSGHANQARIRTFPLNDPETCIYSHDVISFARSQGLYPSDAPASEFSFSDIYDPLTFGGARLCEIRVWTFFRQVAANLYFGVEYLDYVSGLNLTHRMPLSIPVRAPISRSDLFKYMRNQFEDTPFDMTVDVGAGPHGAAFRARPLYWKASDGRQYHNERPIGTQQTGWHFVAVMRHWLPNAVGGVLWFGVDDTSHSVYVPFYCSCVAVPQKWADGYGDALTFEWSAFWVFNLVANMAYGDWRIQKEVYNEILIKEKIFASEAQVMDDVALMLINNGDNEKAIAVLTEFSVKIANDLVDYWIGLWQRLFIKYRDGFIVTPPQINPPPDHGGQMGGIVPDVVEAGYRIEFYDSIVEETGDKYYAQPRDDQRKLKYA